MKIQLNPGQKNRAAAMIVVAIFAVIVSSTLAAYLLMVQSEYTQDARSQTWNSSFVLAEAGMEDGMAMINVYTSSGNYADVTNWTSRASANGWSDVSGNNSVWSITRTNIDGKNGYYTVWITNILGSIANITNPIIVSVGVAKWNAGVASAPGPMFAQVTMIANSQSQVTREVYAQTSWSPLFSGSMVALTNISLASGTVIDSFDSADPAHSDWNATNGFGTYDSALRKAGGNVSSDSDVAVAITGGNKTVVYGKLNTGPDGSVSFGNQASVGDLSWIGINPNNPANNGIEPGYEADDMNVAFTDVSLPAQSFTLFGPNSGNDINITNLSGTPVYYQINSVPNNGNVNIVGKNVNVYFPNGFSLSGSQQINVNLNSSATLYLGADISSTGNSGINNATQNALNLSMYALPSVANIKFNGNAAFTGTIYAPEANLTFGGGGNNPYDIVGAVDSLSVSMNGHPNFHYDENLARKGPGRGFVPTKWKEVVAH